MTEIKRVTLKTTWTLSTLYVTQASQQDTMKPKESYVITHLCNLLQKFKFFDVVVPLDPEPVGNWFQALPHFLRTAVDNPLPLITTESIR